MTTLSKKKKPVFPRLLRAMCLPAPSSPKNSTSRSRLSAIPKRLWCANWKKRASVVRLPSPTITTIIERGYVKREKRVLYPTELGEIVTNMMKENFSEIVDVKFTAEMEEKLDSIEDGKSNSTEVLTEFYGPFEKTLEKAESTIEKVEIADEVSDVPCEKCGAMMVYKFSRYGRFLACPNFPNCRNTKPITEPVDVPCPKCGAKLLKRYSRKSNKPFYGCERYPECDFVCWDTPTKEKCPKCGGMMVSKNTKNGTELRCVDCANVVHVEKKTEETPPQD